MMATEVLTDEQHARFLTALAENLDDAIVGMGRGATILAWNRGAEVLYGFASSEALGQHAALIVPATHRDELDNHLQRVFDGESIRAVETTRRSKSGALVPVLMTVCPVRDAGGIIVGAASQARDLAREGRLRAERDRLLVELREAHAERDEFMSIAAHELKTPLTALSLNVQLAMRRYAKLTDDVHVLQPLQALERQARRMADITDQMLDVSRVAKGKLSLERQDCNLVALTRRAMQQVLDDETAPDRIAVETRGAAPVGAWDPRQIQRILANLISNALKYGGDGRIIIRIDASVDAAQWSIQDQGPGIAPEHQARAFERFRSLGSSGSHRLGLGLWIVKEFVAAHGGSVALHSALGEGTTVQLTLPRQTTATAEH